MQSDSIKELAGAMALAQAKVDGARKDSSNPFFKSKYADLASVTAAVQVIYEYGLSYIQRSHDRDNAAAIETIILHKSGEWMSAGIVSVPVSKADAQGYGSALTYARRYSLGAAFGIVPEDDDGNAAAKAAPITGKRHVTPTAEQESKVADYCAAIETAPDVESLKDAWDKARGDVLTWDLPMLLALVDSAKNTRKVQLTAKRPG
jgi:hypothetical protein